MAFSYFEDFIAQSTVKSTIFELFVSFKVVGELLFGLFSQSNTLSSYLINNPQKIFWLIEKETMEKNKTKEDFHVEVMDIIKKTENHNKREYYLRQYRKNEYLRIASREIIKACKFEETMRELSELASALIESALWIAKEKLKKRYGIDENRFCVIGMGKLGNKELNFSSDIDLLFVHDSEDNSEYFNRLAGSVVSVLNDNKDGGFVYRVDMRLRPGGKTTALSLSVDEYEGYYTTFGQLWEKMALTKAYPVAGDIDLGFELLKTLRPFIYKKSIDIEYIKEIRSLMFKIKKYSKKLKDFQSIPADKLDVKKGVGCIREIEFIVNYFQLVYGGLNDKLKHISTMEGLELLKKDGLLSEKEAEELKRAYLFLRKIEHKIQLLNEQQTQMLPNSVDELEKMSKKMDLSLEQFVKIYLEYTDNVHGIFQKIFISNDRFPVFSADEDMEGYLAEFGIKNAGSVVFLVKDFVKKCLAVDIKRSVIEDIVDYTFNYTKKSDFENCITGMNMINPTYTALIFSQKRLFEAFLDVLSVNMASRLAKHIDLVEDILSGEMLDYKDLTKQEYERLSIGAVFHLFLEPFGCDCDIMTRFAYDFIKNTAKEFDKEGNLSIVAYGKLATNELFVGSDLDIVFAAKNSAYMHTSTVQKITKKLKEIYDVDLRLRPYGDKGSIVVDVDYLDEYFQKNAWQWEKQAALKSKIIYCGFDKSILENVYKRFVSNNPPSKEDILKMRNKIVESKGKDYDIKSFAGGITDIEFLAQAACFEKGCADTGLSTTDMLKRVEKFGLFDVDFLIDTYKFYIFILNIYRTYAKGSVIKDCERLEFYTKKDNIKNEIESRRLKVKHIFEEFFK